MEHIYDIAQRVVGEAVHRREAVARAKRADDVSSVQFPSAKEERPLPERVGD